MKRKRTGEWNKNEKKKLCILWEMQIIMKYERDLDRFYLFRDEWRKEWNKKIFIHI